MQGNCKGLNKKLIKFPVSEELKVLNEFNEMWRFLNCGGVINGCHIPIIASTKFHSDYYNRKGWFSMILQGVADHKYRFIDVYTGWPGRVHNARVFANSPIYKKGIEGRLFRGLKKSIGSKDVPVCLPGDSAYPLKSWLLGNL